MKKIIVVCALCALLAGCASAPRYQLTEKEAAGKEFSLAPGETVRITVVENPTTGYLWYHTVTGEAVQVTKSEYTPPQGTMCGAPGKRSCTVEAVKPGSAVLELRSRRPWLVPQPDDRILKYSFLVAGSEKQKTPPPAAGKQPPQQR